MELGRKNNRGKCGCGCLNCVVKGRHHPGKGACGVPKK